LKLFSLVLVSIFLSSFVFSDNVQAEKLIRLAKKEVGSITPKELKRKIDTDEAFVLLDVREPHDRFSGEIYSSEYYALTRGSLEFEIGNKIKDKKSLIITYCIAGNASALAAQTLRLLGYKNATSLEGGLKAWVKAGYPLETDIGVFKRINDD